MFFTSKMFQGPRKTVYRWVTLSRCDGQTSPLSRWSQLQVSQRELNANAQPLENAEVVRLQGTDKEGEMVKVIFFVLNPMRISCICSVQNPQWIILSFISQRSSEISPLWVSIHSCGHFFQGLLRFCFYLLSLINNTVTYLLCTVSV